MPWLYRVHSSPNVIIDAVPAGAQVEGLVRTDGSRRHLWSWLLAVPLAAVLLYFAVRGVDWKNVWRTIAGADVRFIAAALCATAFSFFLRSVRWRVLLNAEGRFSIPTVFWINMAGYLGNNFLPARAGEVLRSFLISRHSSLSKTYVLTTALSERMMDVVALVLASSVALLGIQPKPAWMESASRTMALVAGCGVAVVIALPHTGGLLESLLQRLPLPVRLRTLLMSLMKQVLMGLSAFHNWGRLAAFIVLTAMIWTSDSIGVVLGAHALGITVSIPVALLLLTGLGLGSALPSTPGYVGIYQMVAVTVLVPFGVSHDGAMAYILVSQVLGYLVIVAFGLPGLYQYSGKGAGQAAATLGS